MNITSTFDSWLFEKNDLVTQVKSEMGDHRFAHTLAVAKEALVLAKAFSLSEQNAKRLFVAALLHDYTKAYSTERQLSLAKEYGVTLSDDDLASPPILHSRTAAAVVMQVFPHDTDLEIAEAIRCHTVGKKDMSLFDKLLFLADYIEETRTHLICQETRKSFYENLASGNNKEQVLNNTLRQILKNTIDHLAKQGSKLHSDSLKMLENL